MKRHKLCSFLLTLILIFTCIPISSNGANIPASSDSIPSAVIQDDDNATLYAASKKIKTKKYTISKRAGTYSSRIKVKIKAKKGYKIYYSLNGKFKAKKVIKSKKTKTLTISSTKTLYIYAVKSSKKIKAKNLKTKAIKKAKKYTYVIKKSNTNPGITKTYTVTFNTNGGTSVASQTVKEGSKATRPANPTRSGYGFAGWYTNANCTTEYNFNTPVTSNITLYAKWTQNVYTVSFETNGGSQVEDQTIYYGERAINPEAPIRQGYVFAGWYIDAGLSEPYDFSSPVENDFTLYAAWDEIDVTITMNQDTEDETINNRTITGSISSNISIEQVTYTLTSTNKNESANITLSDDNTFSQEVLLEGGENIFTVSVYTLDGSETTASITMNYDSGEIVDYSNTGEVYDPTDPRVVTKTTENEDGTSTTFVTNVLNIFFSETTTFEQRETFITETLNGTVAGYLNTVNMMQAWLPEELIPVSGYEGETLLADITDSDLNAYAAAVAQANDTIIDDAYIDYIYEEGFELTTNDPWSGTVSNGSTSTIDDNDWWSDYVNFPDSWEYDDSYNSDYLSNIQLGVVDAGFRDTHEELDNLTIISDEDSEHSHGTHVAGIIAATANNDVGLAGGTYNNATIRAYDASSAAENSSFAHTQIYAGLTKTVESGAKAINFSLGSAGSTANPRFKSEEEINSAGSTSSRYIGNLLANQYDFIVVQSAGNAGIDSINNGTFASVNADNCVSVGSISASDIMSRILIVSAIDNSGQMATFSCGGTAGTNAIAAPGVGIFSCGDNSDSDYAYKNGTSMAAPIITAACGLVWSVNENLTGAEVVTLMLDTTNGTAATNSSSNTTGGMGILDANAAVEAAIETLPTHYGYVVDALNGESVVASIIIHKGGIDGDVIGSEQVYETDSDGYFTLPKIPFGSYTLEISANDYITTSLSFGRLPIDEDNNTVNLGTIGLTPTMEESEYRIILRWTGEPSDLDSHLVATTTDGDYYHVYYSNQTPSPSYANLDRDDTSYEGPETITITNFNSLRNIRYAVHDYTNRDSSSSTVLSNSGAYVEVYRGSTLLRTFNVPTNTGGTEWDVFAFDANGNVVSTNTMKYCSSPSNVLSDTSTASIDTLSIEEVEETELKDYER